MSEEVVFITRSKDIIEEIMQESGIEITEDNFEKACSAIKENNGMQIEQIIWEEIEHILKGEFNLEGSDL